MNLPLSDRERTILLLERYGEIPRKGRQDDEREQHYERHTPIWRPWEVDDDRTQVQI